VYATVNNAFIHKKKKEEEEGKKKERTRSAVNPVGRSRISWSAALRSLRRATTGIM
jgi:hypothetical protein